MVTCYKCKGAGFFEQYRHLMDGMCWECLGSGKVGKRETKKLKESKCKEVKLAPGHYEIYVNDVLVAETWKEGPLWMLDEITPQNETKKTNIAAGNKKLAVQLFLNK